MKLSVMSYTISRQVKPGDPVDIASMARLAREIGTDGLDLVTLYGHEAADVRAMLDDHGVHCVCYTIAGHALGSPDSRARRRRAEEIKAEIETATVLGAPAVMVVTPPHKGQDPRTCRRLYIEGFNLLVEAAGNAGVYLTLENFPGAGSPFVTADDFFEARRAIPELRLTFDSGNAFTGEDPADSFRRSADYVVFSHFKDWDRVSPAEGRLMTDGKYYRPALIGEGILDHRSCLAAMKRAGYGGYINIEYEGDRYDPYEATRRAADFLKAILADLG
jgi:sugar phosphate isomerase/epimerase